MSSPRTARRGKKSRALRGRNSARKKLSFSGKKKTSPDRTKASWQKSYSRQGQNLLARLEQMMENTR